MAKRNLELKTSPRPKDRPAGLGMSLEDDAFNQRARAASEESANVEFRASLQPQMSYNPLARLGYDPNKAKVVDYETDNAFYWSPYNSQEDVDEFFTGAEEPPKNYKKGDVAPDDVVAFSSSESPLTSAFPSIWSHEFTHRGVGQVIEYMREDPKDFTKKYGKAATDRLIRIDEGSSSELNENLTELFDDLSAVEKIGGELVDHEAKLDNGNYAGSIEEFQKEIAKKKPEDRWDHNTSKYADVVGIMTAAQDLLTAKGEPPIAEQKQKGFFGRIKETLGFAQGGAAMRTDDQMKLYALGGMNDDGMDVDPISGNEIPPGSMAREVRDDIPAQLSDGEYVVPADVVRFFGVKYFEDLRQEAKIGLQRMEQDGRIGGEPVEMGKGLTEGDLAALEEMTRTGVASGGLMDKLAYTAMNDPMVNQRLNAGGLPVKFAVGGLAQSQYSDPNQVDQIINRITSAVQQKPELMQQLASRGISVNRTEANVPAQDLQKDNSPSQTTNPIMAAAGTYVNPSNVGFQAPMYVPPEFGTLGGSYFTPQQYGLPPTPVAPLAEVPITCPPGFKFDAATKSCIFEQVNEKDTGGDNKDFGQDNESGKYPEPKENYFDMTEAQLADVSNINMDGIGRLGKAAASVFGPAGMIMGGVANMAMQGQSIAEVNARALHADLMGYTKTANDLRATAATMAGKANPFVEGLYKIGQLSGVNYLANQLHHNAPLGMPLDTQKLGLTERQFGILQNSVAPTGMKYDPTTESYTRTGTAAPETSVTPRGRPSNLGRGSTVTDKKSGGGSNFSNRDQGTGQLGGGSAGGNQGIGDKDKSVSDRSKEAADKGRAKDGKSSTESAVDAGYDPGGEFNKGGLMTRNKKKK